MLRRSQCRLEGLVATITDQNKTDKFLARCGSRLFSLAANYLYFFDLAYNFKSNSLFSPR